MERPVSYVVASINDLSPTFTKCILPLSKQYVMHGQLSRTFIPRYRLEHHTRGLS